MVHMFIKVVIYLYYQKPNAVFEAHYLKPLASWQKKKKTCIRLQLFIKMFELEE